MDYIAKGAGDRTSSINEEGVHIAVIFDDQYGLHKLAPLSGAEIATAIAFAFLYIVGHDCFF